MATHSYWRILIDLNNGDSFTGLLTLEFRAAHGGAPVSTGGTPLASGGTPSRAFIYPNADPTLRWENSGSTGQYIGYQFASPVDIVEVAITPDQFIAQAPKHWKLQYSDDGSAWSTLWDITDGWGCTGTDWVWKRAQIFGDPDDAIGYRIFSLTNNGDSFTGLQGLEFREVAGVAQVLANYGAPIASGYSPDDTRAPQVAFLGNSGGSERWQQNISVNAWIGIIINDLLFDPAEVFMRATAFPAQTPQTFNVQYSVDRGANWTTAFSVTTGSSGWASGEARTFAFPAPASSSTPATPGRITQAARLSVAAYYPQGRVTQAVRLTVAQGRYPARVTQAVRLTVARAVACVTHWQQLWTIQRRDGVTFRFTSLDRDFVQGFYTFKSCGSLMPSAAEESSAVGSVSSLELTGILSDESIKEADLYGGLFDDALVEVWLVAFEGTESPRRLAAGWIGAIQHGEQGWTGEVIGPGAKLDQQALVVPYAPACRWTFGDSRCTKDLSALQTTGQVTASGNRGFFVTDAPDPANGSQWENGRVIWTSGQNAGVTCEVKSVDFAAAGGTAIELWALTPFLPEIGDDLVLQPGCDLSQATCKQVYGNLINFGGFAEVPGNDALGETPIAKIDS